jgi:hypothetical protein
MKQGLRGLIVATLCCVAFTIIPSARAAHATNFLDALHTEVSNRLDVASIPDDEEKALTAANKALLKNTKTVQQDLAALTAAARALDKAYTDDATLDALEDEALDAYAAEGQARLDDALVRVGTNAIPRGLSNQIAKAQAALDTAVATTNGTGARAKALSKAFSKIAGPVKAIVRKYGSGGGGNTGPVEAPANVDWREFLMTQKEFTDEPTIFYLHTYARNPETQQLFLYYNYTSHHPEEVGTWTYEKTGAKTAVIHCDRDFAESGGSLESHDINLTFTSSTGGTFSTQDVFNRPVTGNFVMGEPVQ